MTQMVFGVDFGALSAAFMGLILFGLGYNAALEWAEKAGYLEGFTWLWVAGGVFVTLCVVAVLNLTAALLTLVCFVASGLFMAVGAIKRYVTAREAAKAAIRGELK